MKKTKLLKILTATSSVAMFIPLVANLSSCSKNNKSTAIPDKFLKINGNVLSGIDTEADLSAYDTLLIPDNVRSISSNAFVNVFKSKTIKKIVLPSNLREIGENAFEGCSDITTLDLSKLDREDLTYLEINENVFKSWADKGTINWGSFSGSDKTKLETMLTNAGLPEGWIREITDPTDLQILKKVNKILAEGEVKNTMYDALQAVKAGGIDLENIPAETENAEFVWDQSQNRFAVINSITGEYIYTTEGYTQNTKVWQLWKMVDEDTFDSYCKYSQYLKNASTYKNGLTKVDYSFISGFDAGENTDVKTVHYFYEKDDDGKAVEQKDIIINTNSLTTDVDISAYAGNGSTEEGDIVTHHGKMGELTVVSNNKYYENGTALVCTAYDGEIQIAQSANIELTYVKAEVTLTDFKESGSLIDEIYILPELPKEVKDKIKHDYPTSEEKTEAQYEEAKEEKYQEESIPVTYIFDATDGTNTVHFSSLSEVAAWSNTDHPAEAGKPPRTFAGWTITLNKDYDMSLECETWVPIGNDFAGSFTNAFKGTFDGNGHSIVNFNLKDTTVKVALFGVLIGTIKNFNIVDSKHTSTQASNPMVVVWTEGDVLIDNVNLYNCQVECTKSNGLFMWAGEAASEIKITNCLIDEYCSIVNTAGANTAGFVGQFCDFTKVHLENLTNKASVTGYANVGGIVGQYGSGAGSGVFKNCKNTGKITITNGKTSCYCGGLVGYFNSGAIKSGTSISFENCENSGTVTSTYTGAGNLNTVCGGLYGFTNVFPITCTNCKNSGNIGLIEDENENAYVCNWAGGFSGKNNAASNTPEVFIGCTNEGTIYATNGVGHLATTLLGNQQYAQDCTIEKGKLIITGGAVRIKIPGEPD